MKAIIMNPAVLEYTLRGIHAASKVAVPAASVGMANMAVDNKNQNATPTANEPPWVRVQLSDGGMYEVHPDDISELLRRDPQGKILQ